ncbi:MAG: hypothetical protein AAEC10_06250 [Rhodospirillales bacterium]
MSDEQLPPDQPLGPNNGTPLHGSAPPPSLGEGLVTGGATEAVSGVKPVRKPVGDLADHFLSCSKLGRYLTVSDGSRFVITDDFRTESVQLEAAAVASIYSKDNLVAQAALLPLGDRAHRLAPRQKEKYERLFTLIEEQTLSDAVQTSARAIREASFRAVEIRAIEAELGDKLSPARQCYRRFLEVVKSLMDRKVTAGPFLDEFRGFTQDIAGRLDFGIYSFCLDRLFGSLRVPMKVKKLLVLELLNYSPLIRRELLTNILAYPGQSRELVDFVKYMVQTELGNNTAIEIELLEAFKLQRLSLADIEGSLMSGVAS